jgi:hypothetical protein
MDADGLRDALVLRYDGLTLRMLLHRADVLELHPLLRTAVDVLGRCAAGTLSSGGEFLCWSDRPAALTLLQRH